MFCDELLDCEQQSSDAPRGGIFMPVSQSHAKPQSALKPENSEEVINFSSPNRFGNREITWLRFNERVLEEAMNTNHPLLERVRFLSISGANLDEFYMVRVAGIRGQIAAGVETVTQDGLTPAQQLSACNRVAAELMENQQKCYDHLRQELLINNIHILKADDLTVDDRTWLQTHFLEHIFPVLTPLAIDPAHPFPFIPNLGVAMVLKLTRQSNGESMNALIPIPNSIE